MINYPDKCENCGGSFEYDVKSNAFVCPNCGNFVAVKLEVAEEKNYDERLVNETNFTSDTKTIKCDNCGAIDIMNAGDFADTCPFCGSAHIEESSGSSGFSPNGILPFSITKEEALAAIKNRISRSVWAPKAFKNNLILHKIRKIYTPVFSFDARVNGMYTARLGRDIESRIRNRDGSFSTITQTEWFNASGEIRHRIDDILINAGQMIDSNTMAELEPYDSNRSIKYNKIFLKGSSANIYKKDVKSSFEQAKTAITVDIKDIIVKQNNADRVSSLDLDINFSNVKYKHLLLPVYNSGFTYDNKNYNVYVNGTTGKVVGKLPVSKSKLWGTVIGALLGIGAIVLAIILL